MTLTPQKIVPFLWFDNHAEEAAEFYCSIFNNSKITMRSSMLIQFELEGIKFMGLNGGPQFKPTEALSLYVNCNTQGEIDELWEKFIADGGEESRCGWLRDKYGFSWQVIPEVLGKLMGDPDPQKAQRVMDTILQMNKIIIADLEAAYNG